MALEQTIMAEMKQAMLAKDEKTLRAVRAIKAAIILSLSNVTSIVMVDCFIKYK